MRRLVIGTLALALACSGESEPSAEPGTVAVRASDRFRKSADLAGAAIVLELRPTGQGEARTFVWPFSPADPNTAYDRWSPRVSLDWRLPELPDGEYEVHADLVKRDGAKEPLHFSVDDPKRGTHAREVDVLSVHEGEPAKSIWLER